MMTYYRVEDSNIGGLKSIHTKLQFRLQWLGRRLDRKYEQAFLGEAVEYAEDEKEYCQTYDLEQTIRNQLVDLIMNTLGKDIGFL